MTRPPWPDDPENFAIFPLPSFSGPAPGSLDRKARLHQPGNEFLSILNLIAYQRDLIHRSTPCLLSATARYKASAWALVRRA